jgi:V-type H+-transporting ATPase subunit G
VQRLKDARAEATKEVEKYKEEKEKEFKAFESTVFTLSIIMQ